MRIGSALWSRARSGSQRSSQVMAEELETEDSVRCGGHNCKTIAVGVGEGGDQGLSECQGSEVASTLDWKEMDAEERKVNKGSPLGGVPNLG